jgi:kynurenine formamidase
MIVDITLKVTPKIVNDASGAEKKVLSGHVGTHFDVMNKEFPLEFLERKGLVFDVKGIFERDIEISDIDMSMGKEGMFVAFYSGYIEQVEYGTKEYFTNHPQLSDELIEALLEKKVSIIGVDFAGIRMGKEHTPKDQYCADRGAFVVENLVNLDKLVGLEDVVISTYPINYEKMTGLPCRVVARG